jgi:uncharacterized membrane protein
MATNDPDSAIDTVAAVVQDLAGESPTERIPPPPLPVDPAHLGRWLLQRLPELVQTHIEEYYEGPVPSPQQLAGYERVIPGLAERLITMHEGEALHRRDMERRELEGRMETRRHVLALWSRNSLLGIAAAAVISLVAIGGGIYLAATGHANHGLAAIITALAALAGTFAYGHKTRDLGEHEDKPQEPAQPPAQPQP